MRHDRRLSGLLAPVIVAAMAAGCQKSPTTTLELTAQGGFAYVYSADTKSVEIALLNSTSGECTVPQLGATLRIDDGKVVEPAGSPTSFNPAGAVITFGGAGNQGVKLIGAGRPSTKSPQNPSDPDNWKDLQWVPNTRPNYPNNPVNPNWRTLRLVNARVVLTDGTLQASQPSAPGAVQSTWEFRRASDATTYEQAITDKTHYSVGLPSSQVVINLAGATPSRIVVEPVDKRQTVGLTLVGTHDPNAPPIGVGDPVKDFCVFYELLLPVPPMNERLIPYFKGGPASAQITPQSPTQPGGGSPGAYCPGDWP